MNGVSKRSQGVRSGAFWLGGVATAAFYAVVALPYFHGGALQRYTSHHITEYITVGLFFWGVADLLLKHIGLRKEWRALALLDLSSDVHGQPATAAAGLLERLQGSSKRMLDTWYGRRLQNALGYVSNKEAADGIEEHLRYLSDIDAEKSHAGYSLVRFIAWVTPILGFLGTVVHFTLAISQVTPEQLENSLGAVTGALGVAFDTTALALSLSIAVMFFIHLVESGEKSLLREIEARVYRELAHRFSTVDASTAPFVAALRASGEAQLNYVQNLVERQAQIWATSLAEIQRQKDNAAIGMLDQLQKGHAALAEHAKLQQAAWTQQVAGVLESLKAERDWMHRERAAQSDAMTIAANQIGAVQKDLLRLSGQLAEVMVGERRLADVQSQLAANLSVLQQTQQFDEAVNSLTAAIHLMTARRVPAEMRHAA